MSVRKRARSKHACWHVWWQLWVIGYDILHSTHNDNDKRYFDVMTKDILNIDVIMTKDILNIDVDPAPV